MVHSKILFVSNNSFILTDTQFEWKLYKQNRKYEFWASSMLQSSWGRGNWRVAKLWSGQKTPDSKAHSLRSSLITSDGILILYETIYSHKLPNIQRAMHLTRSNITIFNIQKQWLYIDFTIHIAIHISLLEFYLFIFLVLSLAMASLSVK